MKDIHAKGLSSLDRDQANRKKKTVNLNLVGLDGNAFMLMGSFSKQAKKEGWTQEEIQKVLNECQSGDYDHLLQTLMQVCEPLEEK